MMVLGLTGSIGMGKSTAAKMLREMGVAVHDSDAAVHDLIEPGGDAVAAVGAAFPEVFDPAADRIDRKALGAIVFCDPVKKKILEGILHPMVRARQEKFLTEYRARDAAIAVLDIPLLYETGAEKRVEKVIVVTCPAWVQRRRVLRRPGMTPERFKGILAAQTSDKEKRKRADFVVQTGLGRAWTRRALRRIITDLVYNR